MQLARSWQMTAFYSYVDRDATLPRGGGENAEPRVQSIYNSGYHRTQTEIGKKGQLGEHLLGGHIEYRVSELSVGLTGVAMLLDKTIVPATYVYNDNAFVGRRNYNAGVDFRYRYRNALLFGEAAMCVNKAADTVEKNVSPAALLGCELELLFEPDVEIVKDRMMVCAFRTDGLTEGDMKEVARFKQVVLEYMKMQKMLEK